MMNQKNYVRRRCLIAGLMFGHAVPALVHGDDIEDGGLPFSIRSGELARFFFERSNPTFSCNSPGVGLYSKARIIGYAVSSSDLAAQFDIAEKDRKSILTLLNTFSNDLSLMEQKIANPISTFETYVAKEVQGLFGDETSTKLNQAVFCCDGLYACTLAYPGNPSYLNAGSAQQLTTLAAQFWSEFGRSYSAQLNFGAADCGSLQMHVLKATRLDTVFHSAGIRLLKNDEIDQLRELADASRWFLKLMDSLLMNMFAARSGQRKAPSGNGVGSLEFSAKENDRTNKSE